MKLRSIMGLRANTLIGVSLLSCLLSTSVLAAGDDKFSQINIVPTKLTDTTYLFVGAGGNIGVSAGPDGILIIDDQYAPMADKISQALKNIQPGEPKYIINTHYHGDHTGGNTHFGEHGSIVAHHNVLKRLASDPNIAHQALPVITYEDKISVHFNGDTLNVLHLGPGHTDGDSVVMWQDGSVVHMGDLFFKDRFPYIDLKGGGSVLGYRENVNQLIQMINDDAKIIPGHGDLANKADLIRFKHMLDDSIGWMKAELQAGKSLEKIKAQGVPEKWKDWSWQFISADKWIETLYLGLTQNQAQ